MNSEARALRGKRFLASNASLLSSGAFSDVTVRCADRTWKLHKSIICPRCPYFQKALGGNFQESTDNAVELGEIEPRLFKHVVDYLYSGDCYWKELRAENSNTYVICSELCFVADYLGMEALILDLCTYISDDLEVVAEGVQMSYNQAADSLRPLQAQFLDQYIEGAQVAFKDGAEAKGLKPLRDAFVHFVPDTNYLALRDIGFRAALNKVPALSGAILQLLFADGSPFLALAKLPNQCDRCGGWRKVFASTWVDGQVKGNCLDCHGKPPIEL